jgi:hypothetical protein
MSDELILAIKIAQLTKSIISLNNKLRKIDFESKEYAGISISIFQLENDRDELCK